MFLGEYVNIFVCVCIMTVKVKRKDEKKKPTGTSKLSILSGRFVVAIFKKWQTDFDFQYLYHHGTR